jgi:D-ribose pyranose/furanose isomerase RbsD
VSNWQSRIVRYEDVDPATLQMNPKNARLHPPDQQAALDAVLQEIGWVTQIVVNETTGCLVDGHLRVDRALVAGAATVPVVVVALSEEEEAALLAVYDEVAGLARTDSEALAALLENIHTEAPPLLAVLDALAQDAGIGLDLTPPPGLDDYLPDADRLSDVAARVGELTLMIPRDVFDHWQQQLYDEVGMATDAIVAEIRRRLGL